MRKFKLNCASVAPSQVDDTVDEEFMQDLDSLITLEDGSSIDLKKARLLYNPDSKKIQITDSDSIPKGFIQLATLKLTNEEPQDMDSSFDDFLPDMEEEEEENSMSSQEPPELEEEELPKDEGEFFQ